MNARYWALPVLLAFLSVPFASGQKKDEEELPIGATTGTLKFEY